MLVSKIPRGPSANLRTPNATPCTPNTSPNASSGIWFVLGPLTLGLGRVDFMLLCQFLSDLTNSRYFNDFCYAISDNFLWNTCYIQLLLCIYFNINLCHYWKTRVRPEVVVFNNNNNNNNNKSFALGSQCKRSIHWNMGFRLSSTTGSCPRGVLATRGAYRAS